MTGRQIPVGLAVLVACLTASVSTAQMTGDYNNDGELNAPDLDLQAWHIAASICLPDFDLNADNVCDFEDRRVWVHDLKMTWFGDANLNMKFNSSDLVQVFVAGKYETDAEAGWEEGDWDADMRFTSSDFVTTFLDCSWEVCAYENGGRIRPVREPLPEPSAWVLLVMGIVSLLSVRRRR